MIHTKIIVLSGFINWKFKGEIVVALSFKQGVHPEYNKELTRNKALREANRPEKVIIPLQQHIGAPCQPLVEVGEQVHMGQKIGDSDSFVSAPVHASVSGTVTEIKNVMTPGGNKAEAVVIESDGEDTLDSSIKPQGNYQDLSPAAIRDIIQEAGITGMGGAMFPTHVKVSIPEDKNIEHFIINGAECEPYLTVDDRIMVEQSRKVVMGMKALMKASNVEHGLIAIEDNKQEAISQMKTEVEDEENIEVKVFETKYPQGGEKMLIKAALNKEVPVGGLPLDVGVVVNNVTTAAAVADAINDGMPLIKRTATVTGNGINKPCNLIYRIGTPAQDLIDEAGGFKGEPGKVILGGPMMGVAQHQTEVPLIKGTSGVLVLPKAEVKNHETLPCINCARCVDACPMSLIPTRLVNFAKNDMYQEMDQYQINNCIECGSCAYVCPSHIPLVHHIKTGKAELMAEKRDNNE